MKMFKYMAVGTALSLLAANGALAESISDKQPHVVELTTSLLARLVSGLPGMLLPGLLVLAACGLIVIMTDLTDTIVSPSINCPIRGASAPEIRTMPMPPVPGGVAAETIVSVRSVMMTMRPQVA